MKNVYILLMHTNTIPSKLVKFFTRYEYSHVAISLDKKCNTIYSFGRRGLYNIFNGGFSVQDKQGKFFEKFNKTECKIYEVQIDEYKYNYIKDKIKNIEENIDTYKYDFVGVVPRWFNIPITFHNKFVCSYFVADILEKSDVCSFNKRTCFVVPKDFENIQLFKEVYNGNYLKYNC